MIGSGHFNVSFGNWLPDDPEDWGCDEMGNDVYVGDEIYRLSGTDEVFLECSDCLDYWVEEIGKEVAKEEGIRIDVGGLWEDEVRDIIDEDVIGEIAGEEW